MRTGALPPNTGHELIGPRFGIGSLHTGYAGEAL